MSDLQEALDVICEGNKRQETRPKKGYIRDHKKIRIKWDTKNLSSRGSKELFKMFFHPSLERINVEDESLSFSWKR